MTWAGTWSGATWRGSWDGPAGSGVPVYLDAELQASGLGLATLAAQRALHAVLGAQGAGYGHTLAARLRLSAALATQGAGAAGLQVHVGRAAALQAAGSSTAWLNAQRALHAALQADGAGTASLRAAAWWRAVVSLRSGIVPSVTLQSHIED